jgi:hypothetical protein
VSHFIVNGQTVDWTRFVREDVWHVKRELPVALHHVIVFSCHLECILRNRNIVFPYIPNKHRELVTHVSLIPQKEGLAVAAHKLFSYVKEVEFLGYIINVNGVELLPRKVEEVQLWEMPKNLKEVQWYLGFVNFYRRLMKDLSVVT